jgi:RNA polymerase sigma-70 factor, ECF subfamily
MAETRQRTRYRDEPDVVLVAAAQRGEREALDALLRRHHDRISAVCRRVTSNAADAADATQEALMAIARGIGRFDGTSAFTTWAYRVATNASLDELRRRNRRPMPADDEALGSSGTRLLTGSASTVTSNDVDARIDIDKALATLPPDWRAAVVLRDLCGLDYAEIAEVLGIPGGTVRSRIARARAALAPALASADDDLDVTDGSFPLSGNHGADGGRPKETHAD